MSFPMPLPQRGKRALGQERTGNDGCLQALIRSVVSSLGLIPLLFMAGIAALPLYLTATHIPAHMLAHRWSRILQQVQ